MHAFISHSIYLAFQSIHCQGELPHQMNIHSRWKGSQTTENSVSDLPLSLSSSPCIVRMTQASATKKPRERERERAGERRRKRERSSPSTIKVRRHTGPVTCHSTVNRNRSKRQLPIRFSPSFLSSHTNCKHQSVSLPLLSRRAPFTLPT